MSKEEAMRNLFIFLAVLALLASVATAVADQAADEAAIRKQLDGAVTAWNKGDGKGYAALWHSKGRHRGLTSGGVIEGRADFDEAWTEYLSEGNEYFGTKMKIDVIAMRFITPDIAAVDADMEVDGLRDAGGKELPPDKLRGAFVFTKEGGKWSVMASWAAAAGEGTQ
jgi:uncharacterized protein (TIGR02246 family)